jgi:hypothetical protein
MVIFNSRTTKKNKKKKKNILFARKKRFLVNVNTVLNVRVFFRIYRQIIGYAVLTTNFVLLEGVGGWKRVA